MTHTYVDLDVRPILRRGGEPFEKIMKTVEALRPNQGLRLYATFKPIPLFQVLGAKGFTFDARELDGGDWEVLFRPAAAPEPAAQALPDAPPEGTEWPQPILHMDNRELDPPEPMVRILAATEELDSGQVLSALLGREPTFLFPELAKRGHAWRGDFEPDGTTYKIFVRVGRRTDTSET